MNVIWHDLECGAYAADLPLWRRLAREHGDPILDVGAGTGRVALDLARRGHRVTALDRDPELLAELGRRGDGFPVATVCADARAFELDEQFRLIVVPMQTIQLLDGALGRRQFLACAGHHLQPGGLIALAITERLDDFGPEDDIPLPLPEMRELDGIVYSSQPTAARQRGDTFVLERLRETVGPRGDHSHEHDVIRLDRVSAAELEAEARAAGLVPQGTIEVPATLDHVGSEVVMLSG